MTNNDESLESLAADAVISAIKTGQWQDHPDLSSKIAQLGLQVIEQRAKQVQSVERVEAGDHIDSEGWDSDITALWRIILNANLPGSAVVYFATEPDYATVKAFARAAGAPVNSVKPERRPDA